MDKVDIEGFRLGSDVGRFYIFIFSHGGSLKLKCLFAFVLREHSLQIFL